MMRRLLLISLAALFFIAAAPADEARTLVSQGREREAFALIERAAGGGDLDALDYLAWFYDQGRGVARDQVRAARLYREAAERGQRHAQWRLGVMLDGGEGVAVNSEEAVQWFRRAAAQGSPNAHASLGVMYATGRGVARDYAESMRYYRAAARLGNAHGFYGVGVLYARGEGVPADMEEAFAWFAVAGSLGDVDAEAALNSTGLASGAAERAIARANEIRREMGVDGPPIQFRDEDAVQPAPVV